MSDGDAREDATAPDPALLLSLIPDGLWIFDDHGVTTWANDKMAELLGRDPAEMVGLRVEEVLDEQGRRDFAHHLADMVRGGTPRDNVDAYFVRPDGTTVWGLLSYVPVPTGPGGRGDAGRAGWLHRVTPYTERKELLDALAAREQQLATAQAIAHIGSWSWDVDDEVVEWSDEMCRILGLPEGTPGSYTGYVDHVHPADRAGLISSINEALDHSDHYAFDHRLVRDGGEVRWVRARGLVERDGSGRAVRMSGTSQDITDLRTADEQALRATRRLRALQGMATAANRATTLRDALTEAATMLASSITWTLVGAYVLDLDAEQEPAVVDLRVDRVPVGLDRALAERARATGEITVGDEVASMPGRRLVALPIRLRGETVGVVEAIAHEERGLEPETFRLIEQMGQQLAAVADRERSAAQLAEARDEAMEASRLKSEFLATMSHEIRTPMNGVIGLTDLLLRTSLDEHQRRLADNLQGAGLTLLGIINDILDLSKIEAGKLELEHVPFDVREVLDQLASVLAGPAHDKGLELVVGCAPDVPAQLRGDPVRFGQVVTNLGSNAVKFTDAGEVVVRASVDSRDATDPSEVVLRVTVSDTGVGIAEDVRDRLFDAFVQADPSTTRRHGGTGLGLAISKQLAEALGGTIELESTPGVGSTFSFTTRLGIVDGVPSAPLAARSLTGKRALVVDDNATNRLILTEQLEGWAVAVEAVPTGAEALAALDRAVRSGRPFDLAVLDMVMPGSDGLELARAIRADAALGPLPMVLLTSDESVDRGEIVRAGVHSALSKPVRHAELRGALLAALGSAGSRDEPDAPARVTRELGVAVLVVEDNPVNQLVATGFLEHLGCRVDVAGDGLEAVGLLTRPHQYAAVLMDCRMPRLDGYDATRRVRAHEPVGRRVPIIAMTASALEGERERCLDAGMDDFLTKPIDAEELERVVREWVRPDAAEGDGRRHSRLEATAAASRATAGPTAPPAASAPPPEASDGPEERADRLAALLDEHEGVLDPERIATLDELVKDGVSFFERTAASFLGRVGGQLRTIREAVDRQDATELLSAAHQLKGSALNLGVPAVAAVAADLEALGLAGTTEGAPALVRTLGTEVDAAVTALQRVTAGVG